MNRINQRFAELAAQKRKGLIAFCTANYPNPDAFGSLLTSMPEAGVDIIEVGMPFSDPIADGPTIQRSNKASLAQHTSLDDIFTNIATWREHNTTTPVVLMGYYNPVLQYGHQSFVASCQQAKVDGVILVDLPGEEGKDFFCDLEEGGVAVIRLITPTTPLERIHTLCQDLNQGFVYYVAVSGVTGMKKAETHQVHNHVAALRQACPIPIATGFGIASPEEAAALCSSSDAIVVGSALIKALDQGGVSAGLDFLRSLRRAIDA